MANTFSGDEIDKMKADAIRRARQMHSRAAIPSIQPAIFLVLSLSFLHIKCASIIAKKVLVASITEPFTPVVFAIPM